jgi:outer membrane protein assembly factor BamB
MKLTRVFTFLVITILFFGTLAASYGIVKADAQNTINVQLRNYGDGVSSLSNEKTHASPYAAKLMLPSGASPGSECMALYPCNMPLNSLQSFQIYTSFYNNTPRFVIQLDTNRDSVADEFLLSDYQFLSNGVWQLSQGGQRWGWSEATANLVEYGNYWDTLSYWKDIYGNATVLSVGVALEYWAVKDAGGLNQPFFSDEIVLNGVTYNIAPQQTVTVQDDWPMYRHDLQGSGVSSSSVLGANLMWKFYTGSDRIRSTPTIANGIVYIGSNANCFYALNASTGEKVWSVGVTSSMESSATVAYGIVYVGILWNQQNGYVCAFNASNGATIWRFATDSGIESSPTVLNGVVYIGSYLGYVYALDAYTGALKWSYSTGGSTYSSPAIVNGVLYIGSENGKVFALNSNNGTLKWVRQTSSSPVYASPAVINNKVYVCSDDGGVFALNANNGQQIWSAYCGSGTDHTDTSPAVANGLVYVNARNGIYAFNATNGGQVWFFTSPYINRQLTGYMYSSPAVAGNIVYYGSVDSYVFALNAFTGSMIWAYQTGGFLFSSPAIANGALYIGSYDGYVYALGGYSGGQAPQPTPTPYPTATPVPSISPNATTTTTDATPAPTQEPIKAPDPTPEPTAEPLSQIQTVPNVAAASPASDFQIDWILLAVLAVAGVVTLGSLIYIFRPQ